LIGEDVIVRNRTNNALERFNRTIKETLGTHPPIQKYVDGIKQISIDYVQRIENIRKNRERAPTYVSNRVSELPEDFYSWVYEKEGYMWTCPESLVSLGEESDEDVEQEELEEADED
jgi:hypothetical protein